MKIIGVEGMSEEAMKAELDRGAKLVVFYYCISVFVMTFKRPTDVYFIKAGESAAAKGALFSLVSFFFGWWGIPWGPIYTISSIVTNCQGGKDLTAQYTRS